MQLAIAWNWRRRHRGLRRFPHYASHIQVLEKLTQGPIVGGEMQENYRIAYLKAQRMVNTAKKARSRANDAMFVRENNDGNRVPRIQRVKIELYPKPA
jgi:hypothetical protein